MSADLRRVASAWRRDRLKRQPLPDGVTQEAPVHLTEEQRDRFRSGLEDLVRDAEQLLRRAAPRQSKEASSMREGLRATVRHARSTSADLDPSLAGRANAIGMTVDDYVREQPYLAMALAGGVGVLIGMLLRRR